MVPLFFSSSFSVLRTFRVLLQARAGRHVRSDCFERLCQFVALLNSDGLEDAAEAWAEGAGAGKGGWQLSGDEAKKVLALRVEFRRDDIDKLALR